MSRRILISAAICVALVAAGVARAQTNDDQLSSSWANVNVCSATQFGARAQLAGDGSASQLYVRFTAQWLSPSGWVPLEGATSPWQYAGSAEFTWGQAGWTYDLTLPPGQSYQLRALAELQWRGETSRTETRVTGGCTAGG